MPADQRPVLVAFDGSPESEAAVREAATLFDGRRLVVVTVWEPGLAMALAQPQDPTGIGYVAPTSAEMATVDRAQHDRAADTAEAGARLATELGATAEAYPVPDDTDVAETIASLAEELDACAIAVGSRGRGGLKSKLLGSASSELLRRTRRPVLVARPAA
jgi:nucleotide-binding universal stress UspA family protein